MRISDWSSDVCSSDLPAPTSETPMQPTCSPLMAGRKNVSRSSSEPNRAIGAAMHMAGAQAFRLADATAEIGRASCRERVCQYVSISVVGVSLKKQKHTYKTTTTQYKK